MGNKYREQGRKDYIGGFWRIHNPYAKWWQILPCLRDVKANQWLEGWFSEHRTMLAVDRNKGRSFSK